jgi:alpha-galactosidase
MKSVICSRSWRAIRSSFSIVYLLVFLIGAMTAHAQTSLSGSWLLKIPNGDGTFRQTYFELKQDGEAITGKIYGRGPSGTPVAGSFKGNQLHFATVVSAPPGTPAAGSTFAGRQMVYDGSYEQGKLLLQTTSRRATVNGVAERTTYEATLPPARLALPGLHDVPDNGLARTPPMGWNSWNRFAGKVDDATIRKTADAIVASGMSKAGYVYVNIDDTWEGARDAKGNITTNTKFPDMKALADYVHSKGLKIGIYSSPGPQTCAGYEGSYGHEEQDAETYAAWGIDYLKYDLCSARRIYNQTVEDTRGLYQKMGDALAHTGRPIVYSLCEYGVGDVWNWGTNVSGNLWRTTGDIQDNWASMDRLGFAELDIAAYAKPGHWNDPDMLEIGNGGMTADEYRTHMSLWSLLSAPLIAGNDVSNMTDETKSILMNTDVIAIDQDPLARPVQTVSMNGKSVVLMRPLQDDSVAVGLFNRGDQPEEIRFRWDSLHLRPVLGEKSLRAVDLWKHEPVTVEGDSYVTTVPAHGVVLLKASAVTGGQF